MSNRESGIVPALGDFGIYLSSVETAVFELLHLNPSIYFRTLPPNPRPSDEKLAAEAKRFYATNIFLACFWTFLWTFSLCTYGSPRHGALVFPKRSMAKATLVLIKVWILCAGMGYLVFGAHMEGTFPYHGTENFLLIIKVVTWMGFNFRF